MAWRRLSSLSLSAFLAVVLASLIPSAQSQTPVLTWHNDIGRTGQYLAETTLSPSTVSQGFGLIWQYPVQGQVYAQPLAVSGVAMNGCPPSRTCNVVFVATQLDMLYAFNADSSNSTPLWRADLAANAGGIFVDCTQLQPPCGKGVIYPDIGVTGTPVISTNTNILYVVSAVQLAAYPHDVQYALHAIDTKTGQEKAGSPQVITASVQGATQFPSPCSNTTSTGTVVFDPHHHIQRTGLLLLTVNGNDAVYIGFAPVFGETQNGWILGYTYSSGGPNPGFSQVAVFNTTPFGTGGGIWEAGAGLASDGTYIYVPTGNGTFDHNSPQPPNTDYGDSVIKLTVNTDGTLTASDYFTPYDVFSYNNNQGRCPNDVDLGSGGGMLFPEAFYLDQNHNNHPNMMVSGDKESYLYVLNRDNLGQFNPNCDPHTCQPSNRNFLQQITLPLNPPLLNQAYYSAPAYWKYVDNGSHTHYFLYYSAEVDASIKPLPLNIYDLATSGTAGPIPSSPTRSTADTFCVHGTTPSISASPQNNGTTGASCGRSREQTQPTFRPISIVVATGNRQSCMPTTRPASLIPSMAFIAAAGTDVLKVWPRNSPLRPSLTAGCIWGLWDRLPTTEPTRERWTYSGFAAVRRSRHA